MTDPNHPHFIYPTDAWSYVERAQKQLQLFDAGNPESLFYAAFELRMGIESRITYGLKSLLRARGMPEQKLEKYDLGKIFKKLETIDENTLKPSTLVVGAREHRASYLRTVPIAAHVWCEWGEARTGERRPPACEHHRLRTLGENGGTHVVWRLTGDRVRPPGCR